MSRSLKKPYIKDKGNKNIYWRTVRRVWKYQLKSDKELSDRKVIMNDYNYCDYWYISDNVKYKRK